MADESPLRGSEEGVAFDIGRTSAGAEAAVLVFYQEFSDEGFAEAVGLLARHRLNEGNGLTWRSGEVRSVLGMAHHPEGYLQRWHCGSCP